MPLHREGEIRFKLQKACSIVYGLQGVRESEILTSMELLQRGLGWETIVKYQHLAV